MLVQREETEGYQNESCIIYFEWYSNISCFLPRTGWVFYEFHDKIHRMTIPESPLQYQRFAHKLLRKVRCVDSKSKRRPSLSTDHLVYLVKLSQANNLRLRIATAKSTHNFVNKDTLSTNTNTL